MSIAVKRKPKVHRRRPSLTTKHVLHPRGMCAEPGCRKPGEPCFMMWYEEPPVTYLCVEHKQKAGFCLGCGVFGAGMESFDFGHFGRDGTLVGRGYCDNCWDQIEADECDGEDEDGEWGPEFWEDWP